MYAPDADRDWLAEHRQSGAICNVCRAITTQSGVIDVVLASKPRSLEISSVAQIGIGIACRKFLDALGIKNVARDLVVGRAFLPSGREILDLATFIGRDKIYIRGNRQSFYFHCNGCGRYSYAPQGEFYLLSNPAPIRDIYHGLPLVVSETVKNLLMVHHWSNVGIVPLPFRDHPLDGRGPLPIDQPIPYTSK